MRRGKNPFVRKEGIVLPWRQIIPIYLSVCMLAACTGAKRNTRENHLVILPIRSSIRSETKIGMMALVVFHLNILGGT